MTHSDPGGPRLPGGQRGWLLEEAVPGEVIVHPGGRTIDASEHVWLAWITHNVSVVHGDAAAAAKSEWGQPIVLGMLTAAIVIALAEPAVAAPEQAVANLARGWDSIALERPVVAGTTLTAESHIERVESSPDGTTATVHRTIIGRDQSGAIVARIRERRALLSGS